MDLPENFLKYCLGCIRRYHTHIYIYIYWRLGVQNRRFPNWESKPSTQHLHLMHRTHDTTDQWREIIWRLGGSRRFGLLLLRGLRPTSRYAGCVLSQFVFIFVRETNDFFEYMRVQVRGTLKNEGFVKVIFESPSINAALLT